MLEVLQFVFASFWHFIGTVILLYTVFIGTQAVLLAAARIFRR